MKLAILADDFSGAAELAGIAAARGLRAEVQTRFDRTSKADVIAIDTDTRLRSESDAARIVGEVAKEVALASPEWIYKKTDSVLRGHVRAEIEAILAATGREDCLLLPANPSKGRVIVDGRYRIDDIPLDETVFAEDPDFPARTDRVEELLGSSPRIRMPDLRSLADLPAAVSSSTLPAGAADFFTGLLGEREIVTRRIETDRVLVVCGSLAAWDSGRARDLRDRGFLVQTIADPIDPSIWDRTDRVLLAIGRPTEGSTVEWTGRLVEAAVSLAGGNAAKFRVALEGGATAMAFLRRLGWERFTVLPENHIGVGSLRPKDGPLLSVKPGSYPWPETLF